MSFEDRSIQGVAKTVVQILSNQKYSIDYYQREYRWEAKQLAELITDLTIKFQQFYDPAHARGEVANYPTYFLGSIIISKKGSQLFIVDGQQRLTSLTLLLVFLRHLQQEGETSVGIDQLIYSESFGTKSFNLDVPDRTACMEALFVDGTYEPPQDASESVQNLTKRYSEINELFPEDLRSEALPYFIDWLIGRVQLVEITAYSDDDAYAIFETMNDRGLKLTPTDMLKGYLLANIEEGTRRTSANELWRQRLLELNRYDDDLAPDFLKTWLRSQYSTKIRERRRGAKPEDWDRIGTEFHRWARNSAPDIGLVTKDDFSRFIMRDFDFYSRQYSRINAVLRARVDASSPLRFARYNADLGFTLQNQLLLAPLTVDDSPVEIDRKLELVGRFVDILLAWRLWNSRQIAYSTMSYAMFLAMRDIRGLSVEDLAIELHRRLSEETDTFANRNDLFLHGQNRKRLHWLLARITDYITVESGEQSLYFEMVNGGSIRYEVEHVWANHYDRHSDEFNHVADFDQHRNRIGGLLLLPRQFNASYNDAPYEVKLEQYFSQNLLAASLNPRRYKNHPGFKAFIERSGLKFKPHESFRAADLTERGELYRTIAERVWNPNDLLAVAKRNA